MIQHIHEQKRVTGCFDTKSFRHKFIQSRCKYFHILSLKNKNIQHKCFSCSAANYPYIILEVNKIFVQFHCLSWYQISKQPVFDKGTVRTVILPDFEQIS